MGDFIDFITKTPVPSLLIFIAAVFILLGAGTKIPWLAPNQESHPQGRKVLLVFGSLALAAGVGLFAVPQVTQMLTAKVNAELEAQLSALQQRIALLRDEVQNYKTQGEQLRIKLDLSEETNRNNEYQLQENLQVIAELENLTANQSSRLLSAKESAQSAEEKITNSEKIINDLRNAIKQNDDSITQVGGLLAIAKEESKVFEEVAAL